MSIATLALALLGAVQDRPPSPLTGPCVELWPEGAPGAVGREEADRPSISLYPAPADKACGTAVVVCPGGGYGMLALDHEGHQVARWLNERGVSAFVLRYRIAPRYRHPAPLQDVRRAIRLVRSRAREWGADPARIGVWGFSAGGHLASTAATLFEDGRPDAEDPVERVSSRPDFAILVYPVITLRGPHAHRGSRKNLLGDRETDPALLEELSTENRVTPRTPPVFLLHTTGDKGVPSENSVDFYLACRKAGVPAELHIYENGPHGFGLGGKDPVLSTWPDRLADWMRARGLLGAR
jgi:acetyl esterase/lipase